MSDSWHHAVTEAAAAIYKERGEPHGPWPPKPDVAAVFVEQAEAALRAAKRSVGRAADE